MSKLLLRNVFLGGIGVVAATAGAVVHGSNSPAKSVDDDEHSQMFDALPSKGSAIFDDNYITAMLQAHQQLANLLKSSGAAVSTDGLRT